MAVPGPERTCHQRAITASLAAALADQPHHCIGFYWPFRGECDLRPFMGRLYPQGITPALPVVVAKAQPLIFRTWRPDAAMTTGVWDIPIPDGTPEVHPTLLLVPLVGFDDQRFRLGYGGGFYDRTLAGRDPQPVTWGIGLSCQRLPTIVPGPHDIAMDRIFTEQGQVLG